MEWTKAHRSLATNVLSLVIMLHLCANRLLNHLLGSSFITVLSSPSFLLRAKLVAGAIGASQLVICVIAHLITDTELSRLEAKAKSQ